MSRTLNQLGQQIKVRLLQELILQDHNALGQLADSLKYEVHGDTIKVFAKKYALVVNQGRRSGSLPNVAAIAKWLVAKGIVDANTAKKVSWAVAIKISQRGTRVNYNGKSKRGFIEKAVNKSKVDIAKLYGKHFREQVQLNLKRMISSNGKTIDITL